MEQKVRIDPVKRAIELRPLVKQGNKILVVDYSHTLQGVDAGWILDLMPNVRTGEFVFRSKVNVKEIDPFGASVRHPFVDVRNLTDSEIEDIVKRSEFDSPIWPKHSKGFEMKRIMDYNPPFTTQLAACTYHDGTRTGGCWYCYNDSKSNDGIFGKGKTWLTVEDTLESALAAREMLAKKYKEKGFDVRIRNIRYSGGEGTLALDWFLDLCRLSDKMRLDFLFSFDTNFSTGPVIDLWERERVYEKNILEKLAEFDVKVLGAFKGVCEEDLQANVQSAATMEAQTYSTTKILKSGLDTYFQIYNPYVPSLRPFMEILDDEFPGILLKTHVGKIKTIFGPTQERLTYKAQSLGRKPEEFIPEEQGVFDHNLHDAEAIMDDLCHERYSVGYRDVPRPDVKVKVLKE
jgi:hypothetical protein